MRRKAKTLAHLDRFDPRAFARRQVCVLGLGRSGLHAARLLAKKGFRVLVSDTRPRKELRALAAKLPRGLRLEDGGHSRRVLKCAFAVKSPGMNPRAPILKKLRDHGIPVFSELEVAMAFCPSPEIIAITGTNGKTTTTALTAAIFRATGRRVHALGNIGTAVSQSVLRVRRKDVVVLETSSYQLEDSRYFKPASSAVLNLTSDHLDHHGSMAAYMAAKAKIFKFQDRSGTCVFNAADPLVVRLSRDCHATKLFFSTERSAQASAWIEGKRLRLKIQGKSFPLEAPKLLGPHNLENAMAAALLALSRKVPPKAIARAFKAFRGVEHRLENCGTVRGVRCLNDSKATNVDSTLAALRSLSDFSGRIFLILGGLAKPGGFSALRPMVSQNVKAILTIGSAAPKIEEDLSGCVPIFPCERLDQAVRVAFSLAQAGDMLLLSPACASFDQFKDFEDRGRSFKRLVHNSR